MVISWPAHVPHAVEKVLGIVPLAGITDLQLIAPGKCMVAVVLAAMRTTDSCCNLS